MCLYPKRIANKRYKITAKNGGIVPVLHDIRMAEVPVGCGKCIECKKQKSREWQARLTEEVKKGKRGLFVTLTLSTESWLELTENVDQEIEGYELDNAVIKLATRRFLERYRKKYGKSCRHWLVSELGHNGTENVHLHGILWTEVESEEIINLWKYGFVYIGNYVSGRTVNYIVKYINKADTDHKEYNAKVLTSAGIGDNYIGSIGANNNKYKGKDTKQTYTLPNGREINLPIYWRNKIYTEEERILLWGHMLDKDERWVRGERVSIATEEGVKEYLELLEYHRRENKMMGFGNDEKNWDRVRYENRIRKQKHKEREEKYLKKGKPGTDWLMEKLRKYNIAE